MAAKNIKGITIEIGGDTTTLDKALKGVNGTSKDLQKELKNVESALKLDPKNTELLEQKQKLLADSVANTKTKFDTLTEAQKQMADQAKNGGEVSEAAQRELQIEIVKTKDTLEKLEEQAKLGHASLESFADGAQKIGEKSEAMGKKLLPVTGAVVGIGAAGIAAFNELDGGYDTIITKTGATGEQLDSLTESMNNVFGSVPVDAETAGTAIGEVNTRFGETGIKLEELSTQFIQFSEINGTDLNGTIGNTDKLMEQFGLTTEDTAGILGLITSKGQETGVSIDKLMTSAQKNGATFKEMGMGLDETIVFLADLEANGVNADTAVAGLRKSVANYTKEGMGAEGALRATIDSIKNASTETEALGIAQEVFGTKGAAEMAQAIRDGRVDVDNLSVSLEDYETVVKDTFEATLDPPDQAKVALNNLMIAGADLGDVILSSLQPILVGVTEKVKDFADWFTSLNDGQKKTIITIGLIVGAIAPALIAFGKMSQGVSAIIGGFKDFSALAGKVKDAMAGMTIKTIAHNVAQTAQAAITKVVTIAQGALNAIMSLNPIALIVIAITALIAAFVLLYNNCEWFRDGVNAIWDAIKKAFFAAWDAVKEFFTVTLPEIFKKVGEFFQGLWDGIVAVFAGIGEWFAEVFQKAYDGITGVFQAIGQWFADRWNDIKTVFSVVVEFYAGIFKAAYDAITKVFEAIGQWFAARWKDIQNALSAVGSWFGEIFKKAYDAITKVFEAIGQWFAARWKDIQNALSAVGSWFGEIFKKAYDAITKVFEAIGQWFAARWKDITGAFTAVGTWFSETFKKGYDGLINVFSGVGDWFKERWKDITGAFSAVGTWFADTFKKGWEGITGAFSKVGEFFGGLWDTIVSKFKDVGKSIGDAVVDAFKGAVNSVLQTIENVINRFIGMINGVIGIINEIPGVSLNKLNDVKLPRLAHGGILKNGRAIFAEAGPELLSMVNGEAIVTPLSPSARNMTLEAATAPAQREVFEQKNYFYSPKALDPYETARLNRNQTRAMVLRMQGVT